MGKTPSAKDRGRQIRHDAKIAKQLEALERHARAKKVSLQIKDDIRLARQLDKMEQERDLQVLSDKQLAYHLESKEIHHLFDDAIPMMLSSSSSDEGEVTSRRARTKDEKLAR